MAFFKFRQSRDAPRSTVPAESVERMRQRAMYRLIGASLLVLLGAFGFPLLFDQHPRPIAVDMPIDIPDKDQVLPLAPPKVTPVTARPAALDSSATASSTPASVTPDALIITETEDIRRPSAGPGGAAREAVPAHPAASPSSTEGVPRFIVQIGAFVDDDQVRDLRLRVERSGLKTYTHVIDTRDGRRTRVRVGPFVDRADAMAAAHKIESLHLPALVLAL